MATIIDVRDLTLRFPGLTPVRELSFSVKNGETLAIVGESGSGKSLTALAIMRLLPRNCRIAGGEISFDGERLLGLSERDMCRVRGRRIAMVFQEPMTSLNPVLPIGRQIGEVVRLHEGASARAGRARAIELLDLVKIPDPHRCVDEYPHHLSGGMRQRVMIAIAVACRPRLLIADEPTTALDVTIQAQVLDLLDRLRRDMSMSLILITHDLGVVAQWADRVVVMYAGRKVEEGPATEIFRSPEHPYTRGLLAASPRLNSEYHYRDGPLAEIPGHIGSAALEPGCPFVPRCSFAIADCRAAPPPLIEASPERLVACPVTRPSERLDASALDR